MNKIKLTNKLQQEADQNNPNSANIQKETRKPPAKNGRPEGSRDKVTRKRKARAEYIVEAAKVYDYVNNLCNEQALANYKVTNIRSLNGKQESELEDIKTELFVRLEPFKDLNDDIVTASLDTVDAPYQEYMSMYKGQLKDCSGQKIDQNTKRLLKIDAYVNAWYNHGNEGIDN